MQPLVAKGNWVLVTSAVDPGRLHHGDIVLVRFKAAGSNVRTLRAVQEVFGGSQPAAQNTNPPIPTRSGLLYLSATSSNGLDSRQLGLFTFDQIQGKVLGSMRPISNGKEGHGVNRGLLRTD